MFEPELGKSRSSAKQSMKKIKRLKVSHGFISPNTFFRCTFKVQKCEGYASNYMIDLLVEREVGNFEQILAAITIYLNHCRNNLMQKPK